MPKLTRVKIKTQQGRRTLTNPDFWACEQLKGGTSSFFSRLKFVKLRQFLSLMCSIKDVQLFLFFLVCLVSVVVFFSRYVFFFWFVSGFNNI